MRSCDADRLRDTFITVQQQAGDLATSTSTRFYARDIVVDPITVEDGHVTVPTSPGFGFELDREFLNSITTSTVELAL